MSVDESEDIVQWQYHFVKARDSTRALEVLWTLLCTPRRNLIPALGTTSDARALVGVYFALV